jgi:hypothetical protein
MQVPTANDLLLAWERGVSQSPTQRALTLLGAAYREASQDTLAALSIGARDTHLLRLRESLFGKSIAAVAQCPTCAEKLDVTFDMDDICDRSSMFWKQGGSDDVELRQQEQRLNVADYEITYRLPNSADLLSLHQHADERDFLRRCVIEVRHKGAVNSVNQLPDELIACLSQDMAHVDPQAQIELALTCPVCDNAWSALFDIASFLWWEVQVLSRRILQEVATLARAYGWREADILQMNSWRRQAYLDLVQP